MRTRWSWKWGREGAMKSLYTYTQRYNLEIPSIVHEKVLEKEKKKIA